MKLLRYLIPLLCLCVFPAFGADACPSTVSPGVTTCYFISTSGNDTNDGRQKVADGKGHGPWAHLRGMPTATGRAASHTPVGGEGYILRGGDAWHRADLGISWQWGTTGTRTYIGVDPNWYFGASWTRPIFTCDLQLCANNAGGTYVQIQAWLPGYLTIDNIEFTGMYTGPTGSGGGAVALAGPYVELKNSYVHGWKSNTAPGGANFTAIASCYGCGPGQVSGTSIHDNVVDGKDSYDAYCAKGVGGSWVGCDGQGIFSGASVYNNIVRYVFNGMNGVFDDIHNNLLEHIDFFAANGAHCNGIYHKSYLDTPTNIRMYGNVIRDSTAGGCVAWYILGNGIICPSCITYFHDNVIYDWANAGNPFVSFPGDCHDGTACQPPLADGGTLYAYNNTFQITSSSCLGRGSLPRQKRVLGQLHYGNNHCITPSGGTESVICDGTGGVTCINDTPGHNRVESLVSANSHKYCKPGIGRCIQTYPFAPATGSSPTVGAGVNVATTNPSLFSAFPSTFGSDAPLAVSYDAVNHKVMPGRTVVNRPAGNWSIGAYEYSASMQPTVPRDWR
jgi:hypothetical protein